jgi:hypothetical protein
VPAGALSKARRTEHVSPESLALLSAKPKQKDKDTSFGGPTNVRIHGSTHGRTPTGPRAATSWRNRVSVTSNCENFNIIKINILIFNEVGYFYLTMINCKS